MRTLRRIVLTGITVALAACAGAPDSRTEEADLALRRGNSERAFQLLEAALAERPGDPLLAQKLEVARTEAVGKHLSRARDLANAGHYAEAEEEMRTARRFAPDDPQVAAWENELARRRSETTRRVGEAIGRADGALAAGDAGSALRIIEETASLVGDLPDLAEAEARIRARIRDRLAAMGEKELAAGRAAMATLYCRAQGQVGGGAPASLARAEAEFVRGLGATAAVAGVTDSTGGRASPTGFASRLASELRDHLPAPAWKVTTSETGDLVVRVDVTRVDVGDSPPRTKRARVSYVLRVEQRENATRERLKQRERQLLTRFRQAEGVHEAAASELRSLEELKGSAVVTARGGRRFGAYAEAAYYRYLADARAREANAKNLVESLESQLEETRRQAAAEPVWNEVPILATATTDVTTHRRTAAAEATVEVANGAGTREPVRAEITVSDTSHGPIPSEGIPADPVSLPGEGELARRALGALAGRIAETVAGKAADRRKDLLVEADRLLASGDEAAALDRFAAFLLSAGEGRPIERARAAEEVESRTGIRVVGSGLDLTRLRID